MAMVPNKSPVPLRGHHCRCGACGELFGRLSTFEAHRYGPYTDRRCHDAIAMQAKGFSKDSKGFWRWPSRLAPMGAAIQV